MIPILFESFISNTKDVISLAPIEGDIFLVSQSLESLLGWSIDEFSQNRKIIIPDEDSNQISWQKYQEVLDTGQPVEFETKRLSKDGKILNVSLMISKKFSATTTAPSP